MLRIKDATGNGFNCYGQIEIGSDENGPWLTATQIRIDELLLDTETPVTMVGFKLPLSFGEGSV
jgi:hypothetical protein